MNARTPSYRKRSGRDFAVVTLTDSISKQRREYQLGKYGSASSRTLYYQLLAEFEAAGKRLPPVDRCDPDQAGTTVSELCLVYLEWVKGYYSTSEANNIKIILREFRKYHGSDLAESMGPNALRRFRETLISPEYDWSRNYCNSQLKRLRRLYKWAASREMVAVHVYESIRTLESLKKGRTDARENKKVVPVDIGIVEKTIPFLNRQGPDQKTGQLDSGRRGQARSKCWWRILLS